MYNASMNFSPETASASTLLRSARIAGEEVSRGRAMEIAARKASGENKPWLCYREKAAQYFEQNGGEWPEWLYHKIIARVGKAHAEGKEALFADIAGEADGAEMKFNRTVTLTITASGRQRENVTALEGSMLVLKDLRRLKETLLESPGELIFFNCTIVGGSSQGGLDTMLTYSEPADSLYALATLQKGFETGYAHLAEGGCMAIDTLNLIGVRKTQIFKAWLQQKKIPFIGLSYERIVVCKPGPIKSYPAPSSINAGR
jgi:hypothetical protein